MYTINDRFEWDPEKAETNRRTHGVSFQDAAEALVDPFALVILDKDHSISEERFRWIGLSSKGILSVVTTDRFGESIHRIISARKATRKERIHYYENEKAHRPG